MLDDGTVGLDPEQLLRLHRDDEQSSIAEPAEPRRLVVGDLGDDRGVARHRRAADGAAVDVAEPELAVVPPWSLAEEEAVEDRADGPGATRRLSQARPAR